jgi:hypothetical protein
MKLYPRYTEYMNIATRVFNYRLCRTRIRREYFWSYVSSISSVEETSTPSTRKGRSRCNGSLLPSKLYNVRQIYKTPRVNIRQGKYINGDR